MNVTKAHNSCFGVFFLQKDSWYSAAASAPSQQGQDEACRAEPASPDSDQWSRSSTASGNLQWLAIRAADCRRQVLQKFASSPAGSMCLSINQVSLV
jgi:hypothetical protein